jgi:tetratricopeptide (TPR) repeat protein
MFVIKLSALANQALNFALSFITMIKPQIISLFFLTSFAACNQPNQDLTGTKETQQIPEQEQQLRNAIASFPDSAALRNKLIDYYEENGDYQSAIRENDVLITKYPTYAGLLDAKARLHFLHADTMGAIQAFEKAIQLSYNPEYLISQGTLLAQTRQPRCLDVADSLVKNFGESAILQALFIKGLYHTHTGDKQKAIAFFDECIRNSYSFLDAYREKAIAQYDMGKYLDATKTLELQLALNQTNEEAHYWQGRCFEKLNQKEAAIRSYKMALQFDANYTDAKDALARLGEKP